MSTFDLVVYTDFFLKTPEKGKRVCDSESAIESADASVPFNLHP
jgi:hypothetical protein